MTVTSTTTMPTLIGNGDDADVHGDFESSIHDYYYQGSKFRGLGV